MKYIFALLFLFLAVQMQGQELQCSVSIVSPTIQGTNKQVFKTLESAIQEFMNGQKWTNNVFSSEERIQCSILINIKKVSGVDEFSGTFQIQMRRPVYESSYSSTLLNYMDQEFSFKYTEYEPLIFNPNSFDSNLVGVLAYYAYVMIGLDYDSFSKQGGSKYFSLAEQIVNRAQSSSYKGWKSYESRRNRYWFTENYLNEFHKPLRQCMYEYHRLGLDKMSSRTEEGRTAILKAIERLKKVQREKPGSFAMQIFFDAKSDELINIFKESVSSEKTKALEILLEIDPANTESYNQKLSGNS